MALEMSHPCLLWLLRFCNFTALSSRNNYNRKIVTTKSKVYTIFSRFLKYIDSCFLHILPISLLP